jgi:surface-anchored protein/MYXO-CTERM domain-containing protein
MPAGGQFSLARVSLGVPTFYMATLGGIDAGDSYGLAAGGHAHFDWYFTQPGTYALTFNIAATHVTDGAKAASATYTFEVVPEPSAALLAALAGLAGLRRRR